MAASKKVAVITTSTRNPRVGPKVTELVKSLVKPDAAANGIELALVEVASYNLPVYDENGVIPAMVPASAQFAHDHSRAWTDEIAKYDAYIFVVPEYNYGMTGGTKNAIDYLYNGFVGKPVAIVSYGIHGGTFASEQVKAVLSGMKLKVAETRPSLSFVGGGKGADLFAAMSEGRLGETSKAEWEQEGRENILKAFGELKVLLGNGVEVAAAKT